MPKIQIHTGHIYYEWLNEKSDSSEVLVFLHEALGSTAQWKDFPEKLCNLMGMRGLVYDRLGYGKSSEDETIRNSTYLEDFALNEMPQVISKLIPHNKIHIAGHSDGGSIALIYASKFSKNIVSVSTMAAHVFVEDVTLNGIQPAIDAYKLGKLDGLKKYHGEKTEHLFYNWARTWLSSEYKNWNIEKYLKGITCPTLVIQGENDQYGTEKQVESICSQVNGFSQKLMIPNCGHAPHLEEKELVLLELCKFIKLFRTKI